MSAVFVFVSTTLAGQTAPSDQPSQGIPVPLNVTSPSGTARLVVTARISPALEVVEIEAEPVLETVTPVIRDDLVALLRSAGEDGWISPADLETVTFVMIFDTSNLEIDLEIPLGALGTQTLDVFSERQPPDYPIAENAPFAVGVPMWLEYGESRQREGEARSNLEAVISPAVAVRSWVLEGEVRYLMSDAETEWDVENTRLLRTWTPSQTRLQAGQILQFSRGLQASERLLGASVDNLQRDERSNLVPVVFDTPLEIAQSGTVDVFVNGRRSRSFQVEPGNYLVADIPITSGINSIQVEYTGDDGETRRYDLIVPHAGGLLRQGSIQYAVSGGVEEEELDQGGGAGFVRYGVLPSLTLGVLADASTRGYQGGIDFGTALGIGELFGGGYGSLDTDGSAGWAAEGGYRFSLPGRRFLPVFSASVEYQNEQFLRPAPDATPGAQAFQVNTGVSQTLPGEVGLVVSHVYRTYHTDIEPSSLLYAGLVRSIGRRFTLKATSFVDLLDGDDGWGVSITISARSLQRKISGSATYDIQDEELDLTGSGSFEGPIDLNAGAGVRGVAVSNGTFTGTNVSLRGRHPRFELSGTGSIAMDSADSVGEMEWQNATYTVRGGTGVYYADRAIGLGAPHRGAFILVRPSKDLPADNVFVREGGLRGGELKSGALGPVVLGPLQPDRFRTVNAEIPGLPADYSLGPTDFVVEPTYRSGTAITISFLRRLYVRGRLLNEFGEGVSYTGMMVTPEFEIPETGAPDTDLPIGGAAFTDENGVFDIYGVIPGTYRVTLQDGSGRTFSITVPDQSEPLVEIGEVSVAERRTDDE
ncbi:MAG: fimbria/pilus outer membrane usher protein [Alkalispirochaeta sp.]